MGFGLESRTAAYPLLTQALRATCVDCTTTPTARVEKKGESLLVDPRRTPSKLLSIAQNSRKKLLTLTQNRGGAFRFEAATVDSVQSLAVFKQCFENCCSGRAHVDFCVRVVEMLSFEIRVLMPCWSSANALPGTRFERSHGAVGS